LDNKFCGGGWRVKLNGKMRKFTENSLACSFCGKSQEKAQTLISSPSDYPRVYICDECVKVCAAIIEDDRGEAAEPSLMDVNHPLAARLIKAVEFWIRRESAGKDAAGELEEIRSIASQMIRG
jgi:hypothetical protein